MARPRVEEDKTPPGDETGSRAPVSTVPLRNSQARGAPRPAFRSWPEIRGQLHTVNRWAFFLDFDGTLVNLRSRPGEVRMSARAKGILERLAANANITVSIVSGRKLDDLRNLVGLKGLRYFGLHGAEREEETSNVSKDGMLALEGAKRLARMQLGDFEGIWIEDKGLSFSIHHREVDEPATAEANAALHKLVATFGNALHILNGSCVWEVLSKEIPGKSSAVEAVLSKLPGGTGVVYIGDDGTDEVAFAVLPNQITVRVGREPPTCARYFVRKPTDVLLLLSRMEKELR